MKQLIVAIGLIVGMWNATALAQEYEFGSALSQAVAGVAPLLPSSPSVISSHPALMSFAEERMSVEISYRELYGLGQLEDLAAGSWRKFHAVAGGLAFNRFGESGLYQDYSITAAGSLSAGKSLAFGAGVTYTSVEFGDGQSRYAGGYLGVSAAYRAVPSLLLSGAVQGITLDRVYEEDQSDPTLEAGLAWTSPSEIALGGIWTREPNGDHRFALGQILNLGKNLDFLAGLRFDPIRYSLGGRATYNGISLSYAYLGHPDLGATHAFGFCWTR